MENKSSKYAWPYVPDLLINALASGNKANQEIIIKGSLLFADLSGFTAMSEKLAGLGRLGGEKLAGIMNNCFDSLLGQVFAGGGDIIKFGGDAFLALFRGDDSAQQAYRCAAGLISWIEQNGQISTPAGDFSLGIHVGISEGEIFNLYIGSNRREHLFCGRTVENCYAAADIAELGELAMTEAAAVRLSEVRADRVVDNYHLFKNFNIENDLKTSQRTKNNELIENRELNDFIISGLEPQLHFNNGVIEGEHRVLTSLFIAVNSLRGNLEKDSQKAVAAINEYFDTVNGIIEKHGGAFARLDSSGSSEKMLVFFGAPVSTGRDSQNCLKAVLEIEAALPSLNYNFITPVVHRYGINTGLCFVGDVGGSCRREYTAMGDAINLAARLMGKAKSGLALVGDETLRICSDKFKFEDGDWVSLKGKEKPVQLHYLIEECQKSNSDELIIGRDKELAAAGEFIRKAAQGERPLLAIAGEPGAGKSLLSSKIKKMANLEGLKTFEGACFRHSVKTPFVPLKAIMTEVLGLDSRSTQKQKKTALAKAMTAVGESAWLPLVAPLLDYYPAVPPELKNLPEDIKQQKIQSIIISILCEINRNSPYLMVIEDVQWIDDASYVIIKSLIRAANAPGILFVSRPEDIVEELRQLSGIEIFELGGLSADDSRKLFLTVLGGLVPDEQIIKEVIQKSAGNPFYLEEMASAFRELGPDKFSSDDTIPTGIETVITARIDNLGEMVKKTIRTASVIGRVFAYNILHQIFPDRKRAGKIRHYLGELAHLDLTPLERTEPILEYIFKHILTQEVAYNGLPFAARQELHLKTAEYYAQRKSLVKRHPETAAHHYLLADMPAKALPFLYLAGEKAALEFANKEAFGFFEKALEISESLNDTGHLCKVLSRRGELAKLTGDLKLAENDYRRLIQAAPDDIQLRGQALSRLSEIYRLTADYDKADKTIDELLALLPDSLPNRVFCIIGKGEIARRAGRLQECHEKLHEALALCEHAEVPLDLKAGMYNNLGICHWGLGRLTDSTRYYKLALTLFRQAKDLSGQSKVTNNLGIISDEMGKLKQAAKSYEKAEKIFKKIGALRMQAFACANLGTNFSTRCYFSQAETKLNQAREIFERIGDQHSLAFALGDLGYLLYRRGNSGKARELYNRALEIAREVKDEELTLESEIRAIRALEITDVPSSDKIESFINRAAEIGSADLKIKSLILQGTLKAYREKFAGVEQIIRSVGSISELKDYPELEIELIKLKTMLALSKGNNREAFGLLKSGFSRALSRDLAILVLDLAVVAEACALLSELPSNMKAKIEGLFNRVENDIGDSEFRLFRASFRQKIELLHKFICEKIKPRAYSSQAAANIK